MAARVLGRYRRVNKAERRSPECGGGTGSTIAAWTFAGQGQRLAAIERKYIGGSCPNIAWLPSKNILHSARIAFLRSASRSVRHCYKQLPGRDAGSACPQTGHGI